MKNLKKYYEKVSEQFDAIRLDSDEEIKEHCDWFVNLGNHNKKTLLDIGCGTGRYTCGFASTGLFTIGLDNSKNQIGIAVNKVPSMIGSALSLPFSNDSFDILSFILMVQQIGISDLEKVFSEAYRVLNPSGLVWMKTCSHEDLVKRPFGDYFPSAIDINLQRYPKIDDLIDQLSTLGFKLTRKKSIKNIYQMKGVDLIERFTQKHNSTLHLIPAGEYDEGMLKMKSVYNSCKLFTFEHYHTLIEFQKNAL